MSYLSTGTMKVLLLLSFMLAACTAVTLPGHVKPHEVLTAPAFNATTQQAVRRSDENTVTLVLGSDRRNAGRYRGDYMYGTMWQALNDLTIDSPEIILAPGSSHQTFDTCKTNPWKSKTCEKDVLEIWIERAHWDGTAMRRLMIGSIAGAVKESTSVDDNCQHWKILGKKGIYCAVGSYYKVAVGDYYMDVRIESSDWGYYWCYKTIESTTNSLKALIPEYKAVMINDQLVTNVHCT